MTCHMGCSPGAFCCHLCSSHGGETVQLVEGKKVAEICELGQVPYCRCGRALEK